MADPWSYEPANVYYQRRAQTWMDQARTSVANQQAQDSSPDGADMVPTSPTMMDKPVISGRDIDSIIKPQSSSGGGILRDLGGIIGDAADAAFLGPVHKPWDVLRPLKRVMDAENRYVAEPIASAGYEAVTGKSYEDANPLVKGVLETLTSPSTYIGPGLLGKLGKVAKLSSLERFAATEGLPEYLARNIAGNVGGVVGGAAAQQVGLPSIVGSIAGSAVAGRPFEKRPSVTAAVEEAGGGSELAGIHKQASDLIAKALDSSTSEADRSAALQQLDGLRAKRDALAPPDAADKPWNPLASIGEEPPPPDTPGAAPPPAGTSPAAPPLASSAAGGTPPGPPAPPIPPLPGGVTPPSGGVPPTPAGPGINAVPDTAFRKLLGGQVPQSGLSRTDAAVNALKRAVGIGFEDHALATPIMRARGDLQHTADTLAVRIAALTGVKAKRVFDLDETGRVTSLPLLDQQGNVVRNTAGGALKPTIQDVAARLPLYQGALTADQNAYFGELRQATGYYNDALKEQGVEFGNRPDVIKDASNVMDGGFYLPRGEYTPKDFAVQGKAGIGGGLRGKSGYRKTATFGSMAEGLDAGGTYSPIEDAMYTYAKQAGNDAIDAYTSRVFKNLRDDSGELISETPKDRLEQIAPGLQKQVEDLRSQITGRLQTLRNQTVRAKTAGTFAGRLERTQGSIIARLERAADSLSSTLGDQPFEERLSTAESALQSAEAHAQQLEQIRNMSTTQREGVAGTLRDTKQKLQSYYENTEPKLTPPQLDAMRSLLRDSGMEIRSDTAGLQPLVTSMKNRVDAQLAKAEQTLEATRLQGSTTADITAAEAKVRDLRVMQSTVGKTTQAEVDRAAALAGKTVGTAADLSNLRQQLKGISGQYRDALSRAQQTPRDAGQIGLGGLTGVSFPVDLANAANKFLKAEVPSGQLGQSIKLVNGLLRGVAATGDASFMGIQGLLGLGHTPRAYGTAWSAAMRAFGDPEQLGKYLEGFDARAAAQSLPDSREWIKAGLHLGGMDSEYQLGKRAAAGERGIPALASKIGQFGPAKASNQAFGTFGDVLRLEAAHVMQQTNPGASLEELANSANLMTGWTKGKFMGDLGDYLQFAPRFFQSQLELLGKALNPTDRSVSAGQARAMLGKMVGIGALMTYAANQALGQPTDLNPTSSNFMRIRAAGHDISLFGPWDSLMRAIVHGGQGDFEYVARTKASPLVRNVWDALTGTDFVGNKAFNPLKPVQAVMEPERLASFVKQFVPLSLQDVAGGDLPTNPSSVAGLGMNLAGLKASVLSKADLLDELARDAYGTDWEQLTGGQISQLATKFPDRITQAQARKAAGIKSQLQPYLDIENQVWAKIRARPEFHEFNTLAEYVNAKSQQLLQQGVTRDQLAQRLQQLPIISQVSNAVSELHQRYRVANPEVDQILVDWYGASPVRRAAGGAQQGRTTPTGSSPSLATSRR